MFNRTIHRDPNFLTPEQFYERLLGPNFRSHPLWKKKEAKLKKYRGQDKDKNKDNP